VSGCAGTSVSQIAPPQAIPTLQGSYHEVRPGETLWRIAHAYGLSTSTLASANRLPNSSTLKVGQQLFIPLPAETNQFLWPVRGDLRSAGHGVEIRAASGSLVRASRSGRVAVATQRLFGWGKTIVIDHLDGYLTIYAGLDQLLIKPGMSLRQGTPIGSVQSHPLHFEIRHGANSKNTLAMLPRE
jgi:murein DD-endopeptidase MepM/ murein hydrolase activator NlpD